MGKRQWLTPEIRQALNTDELACFELFEDMSGHEPLGLHEVSNGTQTPQDAWEQTFRWLEDVLAEVSQIQFPESEASNPEGSGNGFTRRLP